MVTRLSQKKVKGSSAAYLSLAEELQARNSASGSGGYTLPAGGMPRTDMSQDVQDAIGRAEESYIKPLSGIPSSDFDASIRIQLNKASAAYQKPSAGIPSADLEQSVQDRLNDFSSFYIYPSTGIPYVDMDSNVQSLLNKADSAYQKPATGISVNDVSIEMASSLEKADSAYQKPNTGIPDSDIQERYMKIADMMPYEAHVNNADIHITDHTKLTQIGRYTHEELDLQLDDHQSLISGIRRELMNARDTFATVGGRIDAMIGRNSFYKIDTEEEWRLGTLSGLIVNTEGNVGFDFLPEAPIMDLYDIKINDSFLPENKIGVLAFDYETTINRKNNSWNDNAGARDYIGVGLSAFIYAPVTGAYDFSIQFSGRSRLKVGGRLLFDTNNAYSQIDSYTKTASIELEGGRMYPIVFEGWYQTEGDRIVSLLWKPPGQSVPTTIPNRYINMSGYETRTGIYESHIIDLVDDSIHLWYLETDVSEYRADDEVQAEVATSEDGVIFDNWVPIILDERIPVPAKRFCKFRLTMIKEYDDYTPMIRSFQIRYISSANNEMREELMNARSSYLTLQDRLASIDEKVLTLSKLYELANASGIHPEQFASVRLLQMELNLLNHFIREAESSSDYLRLEGGVADVFKTANFIDNEKSDPYEIIGQSLLQRKTLTRQSTNQDWSTWSLDRLDYVNNAMRLALGNLGSFQMTRTLNNWYTWSTRDTARIAGNYQDVIAQPFYTGEAVSVLSRLQIAVYDSWFQPYQKVMICPSKPNNKNEPDLSNPLWAINIGYANSSYNWTNLRIPITSLTKYWVVIQKVSEQRYDGYTRWWLSYNNTSTSDRLRGQNPENSYLYLRHSTNGGSTWQTDGGYFLTFLVDESSSFESEGYGEQIMDYIKPVHFVSSDYEVTDIGDGMFGFTYQSSNDKLTWSSIETDLSNVPVGRFLKINLFMKKSSTGLGSPQLKRLDIYHLEDEIEVVTKAIDTNYIPTHFILSARENDPEAVSYFISRNDGHDWMEIKKNHYNNLDSIQPGTKVRLKVVFDGSKPTAAIHEWAYTALRYYDVTGQNITALYEESIAEPGQTTFTTESPYPMGRHALQVYVNGIRQSIFKDYTEIDEHTIEFNEPLIGGIDADRVTLVVATGAYDVHDSSIVYRVEDVERLLATDLYSQRKKHTYNDQNQIVQTDFLDLPYYHSISYTYDINGRKETETVVKGEKQRKTEYIYDNQNRISEEIITVSEVTS